MIIMGLRFRPTTRPSYNLITMKERVRMSNFVVNSELLQKSEENEEEFE